MVLEGWKRFWNWVEDMLVGARTGTVRWFSDEMGEGYIFSGDGGEDLLVCFTV